MRARYEESCEDEIYRAYLTKGLKATTYNTAICAKVLAKDIEPKALTLDYMDIIKGNIKPEDTRSSDEIISDITQKLAQ